MNIPDKIYMPNELLSEDWTRHLEGQDTAYIRKDALLEWVKETYLNENASAIRKVCYKQLIEKLESL